MKRALILLLVSCISTIAFSQVPRFNKYPVGDSGTFAYFPGEPQFELAYSEDSSMVYTGEAAVDSFNFAAIVVEFKENLGTDKAVNESMLIAYLDFLKAKFMISASAHYGKGHTMESNPEAIGIIDYWIDAELTNYQIKGWIDGAFLAVMIIYGPAEYPIFNVSQLFLNGFRFPE